MARTVPTVRKAQANTRVGNGKDFLPSTDGRSMWVRRLHEVVAELVEEIGIDQVTSVQLSVAKRAATQTVAIERLESAFAEAGEASLMQLEVHQRMSNTLRRNLESLGIKPKKAKTVTLYDYIDAQSKETPA